MIADEINIELLAPGHLRADLLPPSTHGSNLRSLLPATRWKALCAPVRDAAGQVCEVCGATGTRALDVHERWVFGGGAQRLERLAALCPACHETQHIGRAGLLGRGEDVLSHLQKVNGWTRRQAVTDVVRAQMRFEALGERTFDLDLRALAGRIEIKGHPTLVIPAAERESLKIK